LARSGHSGDERPAASGLPGDDRLMADFLTRLIERSRGLAPQGQQVEPLIAPFYAARPNTAPADDEIVGAADEEMTSVFERETPSSLSQDRISAPHNVDATLVQRPEKSVSIAPSTQRCEPGSIERGNISPSSISIAPPSQGREPGSKDVPEIKSARAPVDETQNAKLNQTPDSGQNRNAAPSQDETQSVQNQTPGVEPL